ncbi:cobalamin biosynthesis protein [Devosia salina]|uniref:Cobalamin biosynthesis protein n=1 Tax=Devosia salina TaxID=2860336 RepID=A0ABX8WFR3_9HYPH|nr:cobalamin biosynthesis protein [Devosia salina]QYO77517.1 cobalamin biosynthesis protein [Devosia salina]
MIDDTAGPASASSSLNRPGLVAGLGLRTQAGPDDVLGLLDICLAMADMTRADLVALATVEDRQDHPALVEVARQLAVPLLALPVEGLTIPVPNPSARVQKLTGLTSVAEAAALRFGPLLVDKQRSARVTCALSRYSPARDSGRSSASMASSMLAASSAGP